MTPYEQRKAAEAEADGQIIAEATFNGFMNCRAVRDGLGFDQPKANGSYYSAMEVTYNFVIQAGEEIVTLIPDGITDVRKSERTGVYADTFTRVKAHKEAVYAERKWREWKEAMASALSSEPEYGAKTDLMDWNVYIESLGPEPPQPDWQVLEAVKVKAEAREAHSRDLAAARTQDTFERDTAILVALRSYDGPRNKRGLPRTKPLREHAGIPDISNDEKRRLWESV